MEIKILNKQVKILENKVDQLTNEMQQLQTACANRLDILVRNDGNYQNLQGQLIEKRKRIVDYQEFLQVIASDPGTIEQTPAVDKPQRRKRTTEATVTTENDDKK